MGKYSGISQEMLHEHKPLLSLPAGSEKLKDALVLETAKVLISTRTTKVFVEQV